MCEVSPRVFRTLLAFHCKSVRATFCGEGYSAKDLLTSHHISSSAPLESPWYLHPNAYFPAICLEAFVFQTCRSSRTTKSNNIRRHSPAMVSHELYVVSVHTTLLNRGTCYCCQVSQISPISMLIHIPVLLRVLCTATYI